MERGGWRIGIVAAMVAMAGCEADDDGSVDATYAAERTAPASAGTVATLPPLTADEEAALLTALESVADIATTLRLDFRPDEIDMMAVLRMFPRSNALLQAGDGIVAQAVDSASGCDVAYIVLEGMSLATRRSSVACEVVIEGGGAAFPTQVDASDLDDEVARDIGEHVRIEVGAEVLTGGGTLRRTADLGPWMDGVTFVSMESTAPDVISIAVEGEVVRGGDGRFGIAVRSNTGTCWWISVALSDTWTTLFGSGDVCTGEAALDGATATSW